MKEKDNAEAQSTQRRTEKMSSLRGGKMGSGYIVRTWGAPFGAQGKAVLRPYKFDVMFRGGADFAAF